MGLEVAFRTLFASQTVALALIVAPGPVQAATSYNFEGIGQLDIVGGEALRNTRFWGTITIDVFGPTPSGDPTALGVNNWVRSSFEINWNGGMYTSERVLNESFHEDRGLVHNNLHDVDYMDTRFQSGGTFNGVSRWSLADLERYTGDTNWISSTDFDMSATLAPAASVVQNVIFFHDYSRDVRGYLPGSLYNGRIDLTSLSIATPVPEPQEWVMMLAGLGLIGAIASHRRREGPRST